MAGGNTAKGSQLVQSVAMERGSRSVMYPNCTNQCAKCGPVCAPNMYDTPSLDMHVFVYHALSATLLYRLPPKPHQILYQMRADYVTVRGARIPLVWFYTQETLAHTLF